MTWAGERGRWAGHSLSVSQQRRAAGTGGGRGGQFTSGTRPDDPAADLRLAKNAELEEWTILDQVRLIANPVRAVLESAATLREASLHHHLLTSSDQPPEEETEADQVVEEARRSHAAVVARACQADPTIRNEMDGAVGPLTARLDPCLVGISEHLEELEYIEDCDVGKDEVAEKALGSLLDDLGGLYSKALDSDAGQGWLWCVCAA